MIFADVLPADDGITRLVSIPASNDTQTTKPTVSNYCCALFVAHLGYNLVISRLNHECVSCT